MFNGCRVSFWDDEKVLELDCGDSYKTIVNVFNALNRTPKYMIILVSCYIYFTIEKNLKTQERECVELYLPCVPQTRKLSFFLVCQGSCPGLTSGRSWKVGIAYIFKANSLPVLIFFMF